MKSSFRLISAVSLPLMLAACSDKADNWGVEGKIDGAEGKIVYLESVNNGHWSAIDSVEIASDATFAFEKPRAEFSDIYRLTVDGRSLYFPIDSTETVNVAATLVGFDTSSTISGSSSADLMQKVNRRIDSAVAAGSAISAISDTLLKRDLAEMLQANWGGIVAYYTINKTVGNLPLFDPARSFDRRVINAVANNFASSDPRANMLRNRSLANQNLYGSTRSIVVEEMLFPEISLRDKEGNTRSLKEEWEKGKVMVVNFTIYGVDESPTFNLVLSDAYNKYKDRGMEIYQVVCDNDEYLWLNAAKNIPWISVYNAPAQAASVLSRYNVVSVPTTFVISRDGQKIERVEDISTLQNVLAKFF